MLLSREWRYEHATVDGMQDDTVITVFLDNKAHIKPFHLFLFSFLTRLKIATYSTPPHESDCSLLRHGHISGLCFSLHGALHLRFTPRPAVETSWLENRRFLPLEGFANSTCIKHLKDWTHLNVPAIAAASMLVCGLLLIAPACYSVTPWICRRALHRKSSARSAVLWWRSCSYLPAEL